MKVDDAHVARAERTFRSESSRHEKGSAMSLIADEAKATENKTARLRALRMQREATAATEPPAAPPRKTKRRAAAR